MKERNKYKEEAKALAILERYKVSWSQIELWYKKIRNRINNRIKQEERIYKKKMFEECQDSTVKLQAWLKG